MSDNTKLKDADGDTFRVLTDEITSRNGSPPLQDGVQAQLVKLVNGGDGVADDFDLEALLTALVAIETLLTTEGGFLDGVEGLLGRLPATGAATEASVAAMLAKLSGDPATQATLVAVLAKLTADPSTGTAQAGQATQLGLLHTDMGGPGSGVAAITGSGSGALGLLRMVWDTLKGALDISDRTGRLLGHVTVDAAPITAVTGPLTDGQLRAANVPVSGAFFPATQPVSSTSLPLPAGAATEATVVSTAARLAAALPVNLPGVSGAVTAVDGVLLGFSAKETTGSAPAAFRLRGGGVAGTVLSTVTLAGGESVRDWFGPSGIAAAGGVYFELVSGAVSGGVQTR